MSITGEKELEKLKAVGKAVSTTLKTMSKHLTPGITTKELDEIGRETLESFGAISAPKKCYDFPGYTCISINEQVAHGIPGERRIQKGDMVNIDVSAELDGFYADTGATFPVEVEDKRLQLLCKTAKNVLNEAISKIKANQKMEMLKKVYTRGAKKHNFSIIHNLCGHGLGRKLHEEPTYVPDFSRENDKRKFTEGMVLAIEPFLSTGCSWVELSSDGWSLCTPKGYFTAQFEHTIVVTKNGAIIVTA
ncbi:type I methionyl aminopeptidase [Candidatus Uabimicrobium amorphum]|uniref:Methionine aminopeptidase n=1 Tax=Uabimicrobium amorphum TaxID=2596890 RepID=A0A5S9F1N6_UABAM|nr:type I methionyl aminopeptidase [Candidatus Uabimicrobium amorphum]BBM82807.1 methionine aminopeptidase [Candidatus Uabimicrobium amorphum]